MPLRCTVEEKQLASATGSGCFALAVPCLISSPVWWFTGHWTNPPISTPLQTFQIGTLGSLVWMLFQSPGSWENSFILEILTLLSQKRRGRDNHPPLSWFCTGTFLWLIIALSSKNVLWTISLGFQWQKKLNPCYDLDRCEKFHIG